MAWDLETEPEFQRKLDWADEFVREEVEPLDLLWDGLQFTPPDDKLRKIIDPLKDEVRRQDLSPRTRSWAVKARPSPSPRPASVAAGSTTRCERSASRGKRST